MKSVKQKKVSSSLSDSHANLSVLGAFGVAEDAITEFMGDLKIDGLTAKRVYNAVWVFAKTKIKFLKNIEWNQEYSLTCFLSKISNVTIHIDVGLKNSGGELCVYSRTELCALDLITHRIRKVSTVGVNAEITTEEPLLEMPFAKIEAENLPVAEQVTVRYTDIDYAVHTNNKQYVRFLLDTYTVRELDRSSIREMDIVYVNQSYEGDRLTIRKGNSENRDSFLIQKEDQTIVKCEILRG